MGGLGVAAVAVSFSQCACFKLQNLKTLDLGTCGIGRVEAVKALVPGLKHLASLEVLVLENNAGFGFVAGAKLLAEALGHLTKLKALDIAVCNIREIEAAKFLAIGLSKSVLLEALWLGKFGMAGPQNVAFATEEGAAALSLDALPKLSRLRELDLSACGPRGAAAAARLMPGLAGLSLSTLSLYNSVGLGTPASLEFFAQVVLDQPAFKTGLSVLDLHSCDIDGFQAVHALIPSLSGCKALSTLVLASNPGFGCVEAVELLCDELLPNLHQLMVLDLGQCGLEETSAKQLTPFLSSLKCLTVLTLCHNQGYGLSENIQLLANELQCMRQLQELDLRFCGTKFGAIDGTLCDLVQASAPRCCELFF